MMARAKIFLPHCAKGQKKTKALRSTYPVRSLTVVCRMLESCLYVLSTCMNTFMLCSLCIYTHRGYDDHYFSILQEEKCSAVVVIMKTLCVLIFIYCQFVTPFIISCHHSYYLQILINSQHTRAQALRYGACICKCK